MGESFMLFYKLLSISLMGLGIYLMFNSLFASRFKIESYTPYGSQILIPIFQKFNIVWKRIILFVIALFFALINFYVFLKI